MKKYFLTFLLVLSLAFPVFGADTKVTGLDADTAPDAADLVMTIDAVATTPANKKVTIGNLTKGLTIANFPAAANVVSLLGAADYAAIRALLDLESGTDFNAYSATLASIAGLTETNGGIPYGTADNAYAWLAAGASGKLLMGAGAAAPIWTTPTFPNAATTTGAYLRADGTNFIQSTLVLPNAGSAFYLPVFTAANTMGQLAASGTTGQVLTGVTGAVPAWASPAVPTTVTVADEAADATSFPLFVTAATGDLGPKTDTALTYDPTTGTLGATKFSGALNGTVGATTPAAGVFTTVTVSPSATPTMTFSDSDDAAGTAMIYGNSSGGDNAVVMSLGVESPGGTENVNFVQLNGTTATIDLLKPVVITGAYLSLGADPADAGAIRLPNAGYIYSEADATGTDISVIGVDSSEVVQIAASGASGVTITPNTTITGDLTVSGADVTIGSGLKITGGAGVATFTDLAGTSEVLAIDLRTENTAKFTTSSGVTSADFGALNLVTTGTIQGGVAISSDADGMDAAAMTAAGVSGTMFIATGAGTWILPRAVLGNSLCLMDSGTAHDLILDVTAGSTIRLKGTEQADGVGITNASGTSTGDFICVISVATDKWSTVGMQGTWASQ